MKVRPEHDFHVRAVQSTSRTPRRGGFRELLQRSVGYAKRELTWNLFTGTKPLLDKNSTGRDGIGLTKFDRPCFLPPYSWQDSWQDGES